MRTPLVVMLLLAAPVAAQPPEATPEDREVAEAETAEVVAPPRPSADDILAEFEGLVQSGGLTADEAAQRAVGTAPSMERAALAVKVAAAGLPVFACGVGLHVGRVLYGNIGTAERLEFSVIGAAANEPARIEALCKTTGEDVVLSRGVADALGHDWPALGTFDLRGVGHGIEVCALPAAA